MVKELSGGVDVPAHFRHQEECCFLSMRSDCFWYRPSGAETRTSAQIPPTLRGCPRPSVALFAASYQTGPSLMSQKRRGLGRPGAAPLPRIRRMRHRSPARSAKTASPKLSAELSGRFAFCDSQFAFETRRTGVRTRCVEDAASSGLRPPLRALNFPWRTRSVSRAVGAPADHFRRWASFAQSWFTPAADAR